MPIRDETDRAILSELKENARASVTELAHRLSLSRATVKQRLDRLTSSGVIRRFTIVTDTEDDDDIRAIMTVELQGSLSRSVTRALRRIPEITALYSTNGSWDLVAEVRTGTLVEFDRVLREVREISGVLNSETSLLLDRMR
ncbi:MAG: Lrp/AsnC family transcriptional regulator [Rhodobacteraceae bacterium]|nr:Lrp/AsnC family transcriptional regulator [Paracoccaceae bacterium]